MKTDFKTLLSSFLPALKRFPYAFGLIIFFLVVGSIQVMIEPLGIFISFGFQGPSGAGTNILYNQLEVLKTLGFIFFVGTIGIRIAFEQLITERDLKLPFKITSWFDHFASAILGITLVVFGILTFIAPTSLLTLEIGLLWFVVLLFLPFAPFVIKGIKIPDYLLYLVTKNIVLGFFIAFLSIVIPYTVSILLTIVFRIELGDRVFQLINLIALLVTYGFGIPYIINQLPSDGNYEKDIKKQHPFFGFLFGTIFPLLVFLGLLAVFTALATFGALLSTITTVPEFNSLGTLVLNSVIGISIVPILVPSHFILINTIPLKSSRALSKFLHMVVPFVLPVLTIVLFSETIRLIFTEFFWELSPLIVFNLVISGATGYLTFLYFKNNRLISVRESYLVFIFSFLLLMILLPFTNI
jgi:hypothetical protein